MTGSSSRISCKPLFQRFELLTLSTQYIQNLEIIHIILQFMVLIKKNKIFTWTINHPYKVPEKSIRR